MLSGSGVSQFVGDLTLVWNIYLWLWRDFCERTGGKMLGNAVNMHKIESFSLLKMEK